MRTADSFNNRLERTGSTPAVANAVLDALALLGIRRLDIPLTPDRVWQAIAAAR